MTTLKARRREPRQYTAEEWDPQIPRAPEFYTQLREDCFERTITVTSYQVPNMLSPTAIIPVLQRHKIDFVVLGLYGISGWLKQPRGTEDFDILVPKRQTKRAVEVLCRAIPDLKPKDNPVVVRLYIGEEAVIDVMKPHHPLFLEALKNTCPNRVSGLIVNVPSLEMALALKFFAMTSLGRQAIRKHQDAHDFIGIVMNNTNLDLVKLERFAELAFPGGGAEILKLVEQAREGETLEI